MMVLYPFKRTTPPESYIRRPKGACAWIVVAYLAGRFLSDEGDPPRAWHENAKYAGRSREHWVTYDIPEVSKCEIWAGKEYEGRSLTMDELTKLVLAGVIGALAGSAAIPVSAALYKRWTTTIRLNVITTPSVTSPAATLLLRDIDQRPLDAIDEGTAGKYVRYLGYVEIDNVRGSDITSGCSIQIAIGTPIFRMTSPSRLDESVVTLVPLAGSLQTREGHAYAVGGRSVLPISVSSKATCAVFAFMAPAEWPYPITVFWRVIADSLPHPPRSFGEQQIRLGTWERFNAELQENAEKADARAKALRPPEV